MIVFADTFAFIAWLNPRDASHAAVTSYLQEFSGRMLTTEWVLMELADALSAPETRSLVVNFLHTLRSDPQFEIVDYLPTVFQTGFDLYASRQDKAWSLTDCISFGVMTDRGLTDALTAD